MSARVLGQHPDQIPARGDLAMRAGEPVREWTALSLLDRFAPGLAPAPVSAELDSDFPVVMMSLC